NWQGEPAHFARNPTIIRGGRIWRNLMRRDPLDRATRAARIPTAAENRLRRRRVMRRRAVVALLGAGALTAAFTPGTGPAPALTVGPVTTPTLPPPPSVSVPTPSVPVPSTPLPTSSNPSPSPSGGSQSPSTS